MTTRPEAGPPQAWQRLARAVTVAGDTWRRADPESRPRQHQAWSLMADVAALGQAMAVLDADIARAATRMTNDTIERLGVAPGVLADRYAAAAVQGLRLAGERVVALAQSGPLPDVAPLRQPVTRPMMLRQPAHVPHAQAATAELLSRASVISPRDFTLAVQAQARLTRHAMRLTSDPALRDAAQAYLADISRVAPRGLATIEDRSDARVLSQSQATLSYVSTLRPGSEQSSRVAAAIARSQPALLEAFESTAWRQLGSGAWLVPNPNERATTTIWVVRTPGASSEAPDVVSRLRASRPTAQAFADVAGHNPFPDVAAATTLALARQGLPPRSALAPLVAYPSRSGRPRSAAASVATSDLPMTAPETAQAVPFTDAKPRWAQAPSRRPT